MKCSILTALLALAPASVLGFAPAAHDARGAATTTTIRLSKSSVDEPSRRRSFLRQSAASLLVPLVASGVSALLPIQPANAAESGKVLVLGGTGFVGSRVVQQLKDKGVTVTATSRDGRGGTVALDVTKVDVEKEIADLAKGCTAIISCIGAIGTKDDGSINAASGLAAKGAKAAGVDRFVYISVAPEVKEFGKGIDLLEDYMKGKTFSQSTIAASFPSGATIIEPTFIYGGDSFNVNPPRVASFYGEFIEGLLSSGPIRGLTGIAPEGIIKIALEPPVSVNAVAAAAVNGALGPAGFVELDTYDKIKSAAGL
ncbi:MAG: hypothetical protein SGILL_006995 [Bacillariaceae sp.]